MLHLSVAAVVLLIANIVAGFGPDANSSPTTATPCLVREPNFAPQSNINHNPGFVMASGVNVYAIWYGYHSDSTKSIIQRFVSALGGSAWWQIMMQYSGNNGAVTNSVRWAGSYVDNYSQGKRVTNAQDAVANAIAHAGWPKDMKTGFYVVFLAADATEDNGGGVFCRDYCGYHAVIAQGNLKYSVVGDPTSCRGTLPPPGQTMGTLGCMPRYYRNNTDPTFSINGNQNADGMIDTLAHEIAETVTDYVSAWRDSQGNECADKCSSRYMNVQGLDGGCDKAWNVDFASSGGSRYLIQSMWSPVTQSCQLSP